MVLGIVISVGILSTALNLFEGYEHGLKSVLLDSFAHIRIEHINGKLLPDTLISSTLQELNSRPEIDSATPLLTTNLMASNGTKARGTIFNAYDVNIGSKVNYAKYVKEGTAQLDKGNIIVGTYLAKELGLSLGDTLKVFYPRLDKITPLGMYPVETPLIITGIYHSGFYEYDRTLIIGTLEDARILSGAKDGFSCLEIRLKNNYADDINLYAEEYDKIIDSNLVALPTTNTTLLRLVKMQKWLIFIVFFFLVIIAGINIISGISTQIYDKKNEIAVLKALGAPKSTIRHILGYQVTLLCLISIILGLILGFIASWLIVHQNIYQLKGEVYFIDKLALYIAPLNQILIFILAFILVFLCVQIPLRKIDKMQVIDLLRNP
ncbi:ABC transporter permease [Candidatus Syntrophosphaera thermopropionivorans]|uniref:ABC transporter permease n=2 Tax=Candidatus Syntrophosphaera thermopropionivorans TaxID=2593015 RepID=A0AC61QJR4_9BACT|nr:ABC transporter permease [Candidatus Syntrophosphaera thermopropionivorans]